MFLTSCLTADRAIFMKGEPAGDRQLREGDHVNSTGMKAWESPSSIGSSATRRPAVYVALRNPILRNRVAARNVPFYNQRLALDIDADLIRRLKPGEFRKNHYRCLGIINIDAGPGIRNEPSDLLPKVFSQYIACLTMQLAPTHIGKMIFFPLHLVSLLSPKIATLYTM
ncbi:hypothetical protein ET33_02605 [Paenibacillus tyrfis]|uniref:Uncharacterized protein n=1 Tax=Paenibacillus tyrfis TaxID=1501230 RepID=A0A081P4K3_9BACL|nr:hypothetical protein ET33_02605 [Paenibacillus tyrfis]